VEFIAEFNGLVNMVLFIVFDFDRTIFIEEDVLLDFLLNMLFIIYKHKIININNIKNITRFYIVILWKINNY